MRIVFSLYRSRSTWFHARSIALLLAMAISSLCCADETKIALDHFEQSIRPLLISNCLQCHGERKQEGGLRLDSREALLKGGDSGPAIIPGSPEESLLVQAIRWVDLEMPPEQELSTAEVQDVARWIANQAVWPEHDSTIRPASPRFTQADRDWWAFQPIVKPAVPSIDNNSIRHPIDAFVLAKLQDNRMSPASEAVKATLLRRLYFDLLGVPPTPDEVETFVRDDSADAWEHLVDSLLLDQRYGEHWGRHWLDVVRYAESDGWKADAHRPNIWRYRDYVVRSFNDDKPYPEFVREQLAGDEIPSDHPDQLVATGFLRLGIYEYNQRNARVHWNDIMNEITDVTGDVFLGLGLACARCHDHKFDPVLQRDYFQLRAFFEPISWRDDLRGATKAQLAEYEKQLAVWEDATAEIRKEIDAVVKPYADKKWKSTVGKFPLDIQACFYKPADERTSWENQMAYLVTRQFTEEGNSPLKDMKQEDKSTHEELTKLLSKFDDIKPNPLPRLMAVSDYLGESTPTVIPNDPNQPPVLPGVLTVLSRGTRLDVSRCENSTGRRTALANWIGSDDNPLTPRVIVNRIWQQHFGAGIVATANDFGRKGSRPTHPKLLDWLTADFIEHGQSIKHLHKQILMSATWRQSATNEHAVQYEQTDPSESLLWRAKIRRLSAEQIRDAMLTVSGELDAMLGGPGVDAKVPRRGLYVKRFRNTPDELFRAFDAADGLKSVADRDKTTTPSQSLLMMNGRWTLERAERFAERLHAMQLPEEETIRMATRLTWGRPPSAALEDAALRFLERNKLVDFCHVLLNSNEFLYID